MYAVTLNSKCKKVQRDIARSRKRPARRDFTGNLIRGLRDREFSFRAIAAASIRKLAVWAEMLRLGYLGRISFLLMRPMIVGAR